MNSNNKNSHGESTLEHIFVHYSRFMLFGFNEENPRKSISFQRAEELRLNPATIALAKFLTYIIAGSNGFERVAVLPIGSVRKAAFRYSRFRIFWSALKS